MDVTLFNTTRSQDQTRETRFGGLVGTSLQMKAYGRSRRSSTRSRHELSGARMRISSPPLFALVVIMMMMMMDADVEEGNLSGTAH